MHTFPINIACMHFQSIHSMSGPGSVNVLFSTSVFRLKTEITVLVIAIAINNAHISNQKCTHFQSIHSMSGPGSVNVLFSTSVFRLKTEITVLVIAIAINNATISNQQCMHFLSWMHAFSYLVGLCAHLQAARNLSRPTSIHNATVANLCECIFQHFDQSDSRIGWYSETRSICLNSNQD